MYIKHQNIYLIPRMLACTPPSTSALDALEALEAASEVFHPLHP